MSGTAGKSEVSKPPSIVNVATSLWRLDMADRRRRHRHRLGWCGQRDGCWFGNEALSATWREIAKVS